MYDDDDYTAYRVLVSQNVRSSPNHAGAHNPFNTWKCKYMLKKMFAFMESLPEKETDNEGTETGSMEDSPASSPASSRKPYSTPSADVPPPPEP